MKEKVFKDPIYGYINFDKNIVKNIIDTNTFQRLRDIVQTSYCPVYCSALHNRFSHSLGVYSLGKRAFKALEDDLKEYLYIDEGDPTDEEEEKFRVIKETFELACLLHDVGHSPFSHTGEYYFFGGPRRIEESMTDAVTSIVTNQDFKRDAIDCLEQGMAAAPHEGMSVIVALKKFKDYIKLRQLNRDFFARAILGYRYNIDEKDKDKNEKELLNILIGVVNSHEIDVDRLDYLIRDTFISGYKSIDIDYERLLDNLCIVANENGVKKLAYKKQALSVLESFLFAHDYEKKWIQQHPVIVYENFILKECIEELKKEYTDQFFSEDSLYETGVNLVPKGNFYVSLFSDSDIIYGIKELTRKKGEKTLAYEYFSRVDRRHSLWKSESEYAFLKTKLEDNRVLQIKNNLEGLKKHAKNDFKTSFLNLDLLDKMREKLKEVEEELNRITDQEEKKDKRREFRSLQKNIGILELLEEFSDEVDVQFDFVIEEAGIFNSNFQKDTFDKMLVSFGEERKPEPISKVLSTLTSESIDKEKKFFYIFFKNCKDEVTQLYSDNSITEEKVINLLQDISVM